ncbi:MAG: hypothetical protein KC422_18500 [Trueperaceae bacterium]|nr:hypothetical protein [Trueperaceae bacterium]
MILFAMRLRGLLNDLKKRPGRYLFGWFFLALVFWGILAATRYGVGFIDRYPAVGSIADAVMQRSLEGLFSMLTLGVAFSVLTTAITTLYSSHDLPFLLSLPVPPERVFYLKVAETYINAALLPAIFTIPVLLGLGLERSAPWLYYPLALFSLLALYAIPVALGSFIALFLMRIAPAGRVKEISTALSVVLAAALIFGLRALRPEQLAAMSPEAFEALLQRFAEFRIGWLPTSWTSGAVWGALEGKVTPAIFILAGLSLVLLFLVARLAAFAYRDGWIRGLDSGAPKLDSRAKGPSFWERPFYLLGRGGSIMVKDNRLLLRDPSQWSQLLVLTALAGVYLVSLSSVEVDLQRFKDAVGTMNLMFLGFLMSGIGIRMAYPAVSLEGEGFWLLKTSALKPKQIVMTKFWHSLPLMLILGLGLGTSAAFLIDLSPTLAIASPLAGISSAFVISGLGVGLGAAFPRFDATNPSEIPMSAGGLLYMTLSLIYAALLTTVFAWPAWRTLRNPTEVLWLQSEGVLFLLGILLLTLLGTFLPLIFGSYSLSKYEPGD